MLVSHSIFQIECVSFSTSVDRNVGDCQRHVLLLIIETILEAFGTGATLYLASLDLIDRNL